MHDRYGGNQADEMTLAGDFNIHRCQNKPGGEDDPQTGDFPSGGTCNPRDWWASLTTAGPVGPNFGDVIFETHGDSDPTLYDMYKDGCVTENPQGGGCAQTHYGRKRIDYIFNYLTRNRPASKDLTCGQNVGAQVPNCSAQSNPERYSDHRLWWALLNVGE